MEEDGEPAGGWFVRSGTSLVHLAAIMPAAQEGLM
jgi:hypothetical protein